MNVKYGGYFLIPNPLAEFDRTVKREDYQGDPQGAPAPVGWMPWLTTVRY
jgi:hypothetical protein